MFKKLRTIFYTLAWDDESTCRWKIGRIFEILRRLVLRAGEAYTKYKKIDYGILIMKIFTE